MYREREGDGGREGRRSRGGRREGGANTGGSSNLTPLLFTPQLQGSDVSYETLCPLTLCANMIPQHPQREQQSPPISANPSVVVTAEW